MAGIGLGAGLEGLDLRPVDARRKIVGYTREGRPMLENEDGSVSTEQTITVNDPRLNEGRFTNIPTVWNGRRYADPVATIMAAMSGKSYPGFGSLEEAEEEARKRTAELGRQIDAGEYWHGPVPVPVPKPGR